MLLALLLCVLTNAVVADPLAAWRDGPAKADITRFVTQVTESSSPDFVPPSERIAVFDNDGTLWVKQPIDTQLAFILDEYAGRLKGLSR